MGCDVHAVVEVKRENAIRWQAIGEFYIDRDYGLFAIMAGVRDRWAVQLFSPRDLPADADYMTYGLYHNNHSYGVEDWHDASYLDLSEMRQVVAAYQKKWPCELNAEMLALVDLMASLEKHYQQPSRLVFWFDN